MTLHRRHFLRAAGVSLALPWLDAFIPAPGRAAAAQPRRRMVCICTPLGLHPDLFLPGERRQGLRTHALPGSPQGLPRRLHGHLRPVACRDEPGFAHQASASFLTGVPGRGPARLSQRDLARPIRGRAHRRPDALPQPGPVGRRCRPVLDAHRRLVPAATSPSRVFARLFLDGRPDEVQAQVSRLADGRSILDDVRDQAKTLRSRPRRRRSRQARRILHQRPRAGAAPGPRREPGARRPSPRSTSSRPRTFPTRPT